MYLDAKFLKSKRHLKSDQIFPEFRALEQFFTGQIIPEEFKTVRVRVFMHCQVQEMAKVKNYS